MIPHLAIDRHEPANLLELIRRRADQHELTFFQNHEKQILLWKENELARPIPAALPYALAVGKVDARENAAVEAVNITLVNDEVVEVRLETRRSPTLLNRPAAR